MFWKAVFCKGGGTGKFDKEFNAVWCKILWFLSCYNILYCYKIGATVQL